MNLAATRDRLEEAEFFLCYFDEAQNRPQSQTHTPFRSHLSAFLGAGYSAEEYLHTALWEFLMNNRGSEIPIQRSKTVTKEKAMPTPLTQGFPCRSERSRLLGSHPHDVMQQQVAAIYARKLTEQTGVSEEKE